MRYECTYDVIIQVYNPSYFIVIRTAYFVTYACVPSSADVVMPFVMLLYTVVVSTMHLRLVPVLSILSVTCTYDMFFVV